MDIADSEVPKKLLIGTSPFTISNCFFFRWLPSGYLNVTEGEMLKVRFASRCLVFSDGGLVLMILTISVLCSISQGYFRCFKPVGSPRWIAKIHII